VYASKSFLTITGGGWASTAIHFPVCPRMLRGKTGKKVGFLGLIPTTALRWGVGYCGRPAGTEDSGFWGLGVSVDRVRFAGGFGNPSPRPSPFGRGEGVSFFCRYLRVVDARNPGMRNPLGFFGKRRVWGFGQTELVWACGIVKALTLIKPQANPDDRNRMQNR